MAEEPAALSARGICRSFEGRQVVEGYSYDFAPGLRTCIVGATGSGKTTLMRMLLGLDKPDGGKVVHPRGGVSAVFQETRLLPVLSAADNIVLATGASPERARELIAQLLEPEAADALPSELSGGMSRCVEICRALAAEGSFIIMDEPFTGLDGQIKVKAIALIERELNGRGLIMVTHDRSEAEALRCTFADVADSKAK